jgi:PHS family inorganic phosphate transporter-like MFS transporter
MQAAGLIVGPLLAAALLSTHLSHDIIWRVLVSFGAIRMKCRPDELK